MEESTENELVHLTGVYFTLIRRETQTRVITNKENVIYKQRKALTQFYLKTGPTDTHTHTKETGPMGL